MGQAYFVDTQLKFLELLSAPQQKPAAAKTKTGELADDPSFQNVLFQAAQQPAPVEKPDFSAQRQEAVERASLQQQRQQDHARRAQQEARNAEANQRHVERQSRDHRVEQDSRPVDPAKDTAPNSRPAQESASKPIPNEKVAVENLRGLESNEQKIQDTVEVLRAEASAGKGDLLKALTGIENPANGKTPNLADQKNFLSLLKSQDAQLTELLTRSGLTSGEAKNLLQQTRQDLELKISGGKNLGLDSTEFAKAFDFETNVETLAEDFEAGLAPRPNATAGRGKPNILSQFNLKPELNGAGKDGANLQSNLNTVTNPLTLAQSPESATRPTVQLLQSQQGLESLNVKGVVKVSGESVGANLNIQGDAATRAGATSRTVLPEGAFAREISDKSVVQQIVDKFSLRNTGSKNEIFVKLDPPSLGTVRMNISTVGESVRATVIAETHAVKQAIEGNLNQLRDAIGDQGMKVESFSVMVGGQSGQSKNPFAQNPSERLEALAGGYLPHMEHEPEPVIPQQSSFYDSSRSLSVFA